MKLPLIGGAVLVLVLSASGVSFAQGGGASSTGTIQGRVTDSQGAVLPGVAVTAMSPSLIRQQTTVTSETGNYRFPALPPGTFELVYELAGFNTLKRSGIQITLGFTANVNAELALATLQETVTVSGASPVIDTTATRVVQTFKRQFPELAFEVVDDGDGFHPGSTRQGSGLLGMADRLAAIGGTLEIRSEPGMGTTVTGRVPV